MVCIVSNLSPPTISSPACFCARARASWVFILGGTFLVEAILAGTTLLGNVLNFQMIYATDRSIVCSVIRDGSYIFWVIRST